MSGKPVVAVFGATGQQGGSVARELLTEGRWTVRALTRHPRSHRARLLKNLGAEVQQADLDDVTQVKRAVAGAHAVFLVTDFWEHMDPAREEKQGREAVEAARAAGVQHLVYSGLEHVQAKHGFSVPHFDAKGRVEEFLAKSSLPYTILRLPCYFENFYSALKPTKISPDTFSLGVPMGGKPLVGMAVEELGKVVKVVLASPGQFQGKRLGLGADSLTVEQYADVLSTQLAPLKFIDPKMTVEEFSALGFPGADELAAMFRFYQDGVTRDVKATRAIVPDLSTFELFVASNKGTFLDALKSD